MLSRAAIWLEGQDVWPGTAFEVEGSHFCGGLSPNELRSNEDAWLFKMWCLPLFGC